MQVVQRGEYILRRSMLPLHCICPLCEPIYRSDCSTEHEGFGGLVKASHFARTLQFSARVTKAAGELNTGENTCPGPAWEREEVLRPSGRLDTKPEQVHRNILPPQSEPVFIVRPQLFDFSPKGFLLWVQELAEAIRIKQDCCASDELAV